MTVIDRTTTRQQLVILRVEGSDQPAELYFYLDRAKQRKHRCSTTPDRGLTGSASRQLTLPLKGADGLPIEAYLHPADPRTAARRARWS